jgi:ADP-ribose pyrophosphatase
MQQAKSEILEQTTTFLGRVFTLKRARVRLPNGHIVDYDLVAHSGAITLVPVDDSGDIIFVRQFRVAAGLEVLELPAGTLEENEPPDVCARREVREETGMAASNLQKIGEMFMVPGYSSEYMYIYLASGLYHDPLELDDDEFLKIEKIPISKALDMARNGEFNDAKTILGLLLAEPFLKKQLEIEKRNENIQK